MQPSRNGEHIRGVLYLDDPDQVSGIGWADGIYDPAGSQHPANAESKHRMVMVLTNKNYLEPV